MRTSGERVRITDEAERVQSVSYSHTEMVFRVMYSGVCLGPPFATVMCKVPCFQKGPTAAVMYYWATLLSKGPPTAVVMCRCLAFKGTQSNSKEKGLLFQRDPYFHWFLVLHISIWMIEAFPGGLSGDGDEFWAPCDRVGPPIGGYSVRLIRLWLSHAQKQTA